MLLDIVEVPTSHPGANLALTFVKVLREFSISDKVRKLTPKEGDEYSLLQMILSVTADNASNNDMMINHLSMLLDNFPGTSNQTWCFLHILSITAKLIIKQFDVLNAKNGVVLDQAAQALASLAEGLDIEEQVTYGAQECRDNEADDPPLDWWTDFQDSVEE